MGTIIDITGQIFHHLRVIGLNPDKTNNGVNRWNCECECGNIVVHTSSNLKSGTVKSCGCKFKVLMQEAHQTHGLTGTPTYNIWKSIKQRTTNSNSIDYPNYGGKGITICDKWKDSFENFNADMGPRPSLKHSVDRFPDNNGNYEPINCRWATPEEQASNKSSNIKYEFNGNIQTLTQIAKQTNIDYENLRRRLKRGQRLDDAINEMQLKQIV